MSTPFSVIVDDFEIALTPLEEIVNNGQSKASSPRARVASVHAATLLLAATFEQFVREMALEHAVQIVAKASSISDLPDALLDTAWRRTFEQFARSKPSGRSKKEALEIFAKQARPSIDALCTFIEGDITQNIFDHLIHNENNMRAGEINALFKVSGCSNVCAQACKQTQLKIVFDTDDEGKVHGGFLQALDTFFERRNAIAHSLNTASSSGPETLFYDIDIFLAFSKDLQATLDSGLV